MDMDFWSDGDLGGGWEGALPPGFYPEDGTEITDDQLEDIERIEALTGRPLSDFIKSFDQLQKDGEAGNLRGNRFGSGMEAILWLFKIGVYAFGKVVDFGDGLWGVAIGQSGKHSPDTGQSELNIT